MIIKRRAADDAATTAATGTTSPSAAASSSSPEVPLVVQIWEEHSDEPSWPMREVSEYDEAKFRTWLIELGVPITVATRLKAEGGFMDGRDVYVQLCEEDDSDWRVTVEQCFVGVKCDPQVSRIRSTNTKKSFSCTYIRHVFDTSYLLLYLFNYFYFSFLSQICPALVDMLSVMARSHVRTPSSAEARATAARSLSPRTGGEEDLEEEAPIALVVEIWNERAEAVGLREATKLPWSLHDVAAMSAPNFRQWLRELGIPDAAARSLIDDGKKRERERAIFGISY